MHITDFVLECRHCAKKAPMEILVQKNCVEHHEDGSERLISLARLRVDRRQPGSEPHGRVVGYPLKCPDAAVLPAMVPEIRRCWKVRVNRSPAINGEVAI
jgi:hypothetical protein